MIVSLRTRILLTVAPLVALIAGVGVAGTVLLDQLGKRSNTILSENYDSIRAMDRFQEAVQMDDWPQIESQFQIEKNNITIRPVEPQLVQELETVLARFRTDPHERQNVLRLAESIRELNENHMQQASRNVQATARLSVAGFLAGVVMSILLAMVAVWWLQRTLLEPIRAVTNAATAIGSGQLHQMVPVKTQDEVGRLAEAFNAMSAKLRAYRQTNTEQLIRARQTGQATIDSFPDPVIVIDTLGRIESANPAAQRLFGVPTAAPSQQENANSLEQNIALSFPGLVKLHSSLSNSLREQRPLLSETFAEAVTFRVDGEDHVYLPQLRPIQSPDGEPLGAAVVLNDVTRFRLLDRLKSDWVATVSHELKTPLTSVRLAVHVLLEETVGPLEPKQVELLIEARESTERLFHLIEQLLALAKLEDGREKLHLQPTDPASLLRSAAEEIASRAEDKHIKVVVESNHELPPVNVDTVRFGRALNNLLDNAITYTEPGGTITLSATRTADGHVQLTIQDTGIGIPPDYLPQVFDRFFRVPGRDQTPGTGLGLAIVREIVQTHGGEITCDSEPGQGTTFWISLPASEEHA